VNVLHQASKHQTVQFSDDAMTVAKRKETVIKIQDERGPRLSEGSGAEVTCGKGGKRRLRPWRDWRAGPGGT